MMTRKYNRKNEIIFCTAIYFFLAVVSFSLSGCATTEGMFSSWSFFGSGESEEEFDPADKLIVQGMDAYKIGRYNTAMEYFQEVKDRYPFSPEALLAELKLADCEYYNENYEEAKELYKEFEDKH
ncbi:MAG: outer membrane protein assembly factor BamD, partial [Candidatus Electrothrix sp. ATG1]|nr:outer membrane protein assembly factor BamD [Candidatus Electrothrix sp. ATG1]